ncbi:DUF6538 domain-containing protein [Agrobacterium tumefaciens]|uniref:DUF6538 domain-containing protein n=1 Tax=Agrobacterium tumefaciens TaxID=358 RepID=UPI0012B7B221|nr:site-specific integrase [Agrobacterium tumefaciens]
MTNYLRRESDSFVFRRRVPPHLQVRLRRKELYRSLNTTVRKTAKVRAALLLIQTERLFQMLDDEPDYIPTDEDIRAAVRLSLSTERWQERLKALEHTTPGGLRAQYGDMARSLLITIPTDDLLTERDVMCMEAQYALDDAGFSGNGKIVARTVDVMLQALQGYVDKRIQAVFQPETLVLPSTAAAPHVGVPVAASAVSPGKMSQFLSAWQKDIIAGYNHNKGLKDADQYLRTVELFIGLMGDLSISQITFDVAAEFRTLLLQMPATHGKGAIVSPKKELARAAADKALPRVTMKTAKRHFSGMRSIWKWLTYKRHVPATSQPFAGHSFPGTKSKKSARDDWSREDLQRLFTSREYRDAPNSSALHWLPLISLHSGMRLEEICRLRPSIDIITKDGTLCLDIATREGWDPKSEAGTRLIPVHSWLISHGFMDFVKRQRARGADHLFSPELSDSKKSISAGFSRTFSKLKIDLSIGEKTTFHSFRHTFRTVLDSTELKESHIDAVMGHESGGGEGRTYTKRVTTSKLKEVVEEFKSPFELMFLGTTDASAPPPAPRTIIKKRKLTPPVLDENGKVIRPRSLR